MSWFHAVPGSEDGYRPTITQTTNNPKANISLLFKLFRAKNIASVRANIPGIINEVAYLNDTYKESRIILRTETTLFTPSI